MRRRRIDEKLIGKILARYPDQVAHLYLIAAIRFERVKDPRVLIIRDAWEIGIVVHCQLLALLVENSKHRVDWRTEPVCAYFKYQRLSLLRFKLEALGIAVVRRTGNRDRRLKR